MIDIHIKIEFHSPWHCGSGLAAGSDIDALVTDVEPTDEWKSYLASNNVELYY